MTVKRQVKIKLEPKNVRFHLRHAAHMAELEAMLEECLTFKASEKTKRQWMEAARIRLDQLTRAHQFRADADRAAMMLGRKL